MTILTDEERKAKYLAWEKYRSSILGEGDIYSFESGFKAGLAYDKTMIKELEMKVKELKKELEDCDNNLMAYTTH